MHGELWVTSQRLAYLVTQTCRDFLGSECTSFWKATGSTSFLASPRKSLRAFEATCISASAAHALRAVGLDSLRANFLSILFLPYIQYSRVIVLEAVETYGFPIFSCLLFPAFPPVCRTGMPNRNGRHPDRKTDKYTARVLQPSNRGMLYPSGRVSPGISVRRSPPAIANR